MWPRCCSLVTGVLVNVLILSPLLSMLQTALTWRLMLRIYDDIRQSHLGYGMYYSEGMYTAVTLEHIATRSIEKVWPGVEVSILPDSVS
jgi:hypothetical protein